MPELPEVEVTRLGISPYLDKVCVDKILVHQPKLRWPVPQEIHCVEGSPVLDVSRRAKYLFIHFSQGRIILHLGMSGKMRVVDAQLPRQKHDHIELLLSSGKKLVLNDPRRFGCCLWQPSDKPSMEHPLLANLGPEPLSEQFTAHTLFDKSRTKQVAVKNFIMDNAVVVGVGNIYANESLFRAKIDPRRPAGKISLKRYQRLTVFIKNVLENAIEQGGTTLKDFAQADGNPGYFAQHLYVYGRAGEACEECGKPIRSCVIGQRNTFYCVSCQK